MDELRIVSRPNLRRPVMITAFRGWNDGGQGASLAAGFLARTWKAARFADIDPEEFFDFQATRPHVSLVEGVTRQIDWPDNAFYHAPIPGTDRDALLLLGIEPNVRWRTFTNLVTQLASELGVELGLQASRYEGPTGIVGVLHDSCKQVGLPSASLWAAVPHYVSLAPSPRAALALCRRLGELLGTDIDTSELEEASESYSQQVTEAVAADPETAAYVEELEQRTEEVVEPVDLPSGDAIAAELTRFLRERERGNGGPSEGPSAQP